MSFGARGAIRSVKNVAKGYTDIQVKVREATSNDPGPINTELMRQIAAASHYDQLFVEIMIIMEKRLNDDGRKWRHVYKALVLLEYLLISGSDRIFQYAKDNFYVIKTLIEFQYRDELGVDHGHNVRLKASKVSELLTNPDALGLERISRKNMDGRRSPRGGNSQQQSLAQREQDDLNRAIQESLKSSHTTTNTRPVDTMSESEQIQRAIELSKSEHTHHTEQPYTRQYSPPPPQPAKPQPLIDLLGGDDHQITAPPPGGDPFALPQGNPFAMLDSQPTGMPPAGPFNTSAQPNPFTNQFMVPQQQTGWTEPTGWAGIPQQPTGWTGVPLQQTGYVPQHSTGFPPGPSSNPFSAASKTPPSTMVDLDNLGQPNRNPFAISQHHTGPAASGGGFNWTGAPDPASKLSLAELAFQNQRNNKPVLASQTGAPQSFGTNPPPLFPPSSQPPSSVQNNPFF